MLALSTDPREQLRRDFYPFVVGKMTDQFGTPFLVEGLTEYVGIMAQRPLDEGERFRCLAVMSESLHRLNLDMDPQPSPVYLRLLADLLTKQASA